MNKFKSIKPAVAFNCCHYGIALIWTVLILLVLILLVGLALDTAKVYLVSHQLQNAADAAALAGAQVVKTADDPNTRAVTYSFAFANRYVGGNPVVLDKNPSNDPNGDIVLGRWFPPVYDNKGNLVSPGYFDPILPPSGFANAVKTVARCIGSPHNPPVPLTFGPIVKVLTANVSRYAVAMSSGGTGAGLIALDCRDTACAGLDDLPGLFLEGGSIVDVGGGPVLGEVVVNCGSCDHPKYAVNIPNNAAIENAAQMNVVGCYDGPETDYPISDQDPCNYMPDPLGCFPNKYNCLMPRLSADPANDLSPAPGEPWIPDSNLAVNVLHPGYYSGGIKVTSATANVRFEPGIYIVDGNVACNVNAGGGLNLTGGTIDANDGVMFYILGGSVDIGGGAKVTMREWVPWNDDGTILPYEGMLIYQDPDNFTPARIIGTSALHMVGTIYFPFNEVEIGGDGYSVGTQLIANSVRVHTSGEGVVINYDGRYRAPGSRSFLVK